MFELFPVESQGWETIGYWCLAIAVISESVEFVLDLYKDGWKWHRAAGALAILFLFLLIGADMKAGHYRSSEDAARDNQLRQDGITLPKLTEALGEADETVADLKAQIDKAQTIITTVQADNERLIALAKQQSADIERLRARALGPLTWSVSLLMAGQRIQPREPVGPLILGDLPVKQDLTLTRVVASFGGFTAVADTNLTLPCTLPPYLYFSVGGDRGLMNAKYRLALPNGVGPSTEPFDSGPIHVEFSAGTLIVVSYQVGFDNTRVCNVGPNVNGTATTFTVEYQVKQQ